METPGKKFTDLVEIENPQDTDLMLIRNSTGVKKAPLQKLSDYIKQKFIGWVFSDLPTTDKTIPGALKELNSALEGYYGSNYIGSINNLRDPGIYWCDFTQVTGAIWDDGYGWVEVIKAFKTGEACIQKIYRYTDSGVAVIAYRCYTNNKWYPTRLLNTSPIS